MEEAKALYPGAEGIGSLEQVKDQMSMSDLSGMPMLGTAGCSIVLGQGSGDPPCSKEEERVILGEMHSQMLAIEKEERTQARLAAAQEAFSRFDTSGEFQIQREELGKLLQACELPLSPEQLEATKAAMFSKYDVDGNGSLTWGEFKTLYLKCLASERAQKKLVERATAQCTQEAAAAAFAAADADSSGLLDAGELSPLLRQALGALSAQMGDAEWDAYVADTISRGDKDGNGYFDQAEFLNLYSHCLANQQLRQKYEHKLRRRFSLAVDSSSQVLVTA